MRRMLNTIQMTAAPNTRENVTGAAHGFLVPAFVCISNEGEARVFGHGLGAGLLQRTFFRPQLLLRMPPIRDVDHEADHAVGPALGVEKHSTFRVQPVHGAVLVNDPVFGRDIARFLRSLERELRRRPVGRYST